MALVELAIAIPFLALVAFGVLDLARAFRLQSQLRNAAREGAAFAQYEPTAVSAGGGCDDPDNINWHATAEEASIGAGAVVTVTDVTTGTDVVGCYSATVSPGRRVKVTVAKSFRVLTPMIGHIVGTDVTVRGSTEVVVQGTGS